MPDPILQDVADTAFWVATYRARETERPDALFRDPLAAKLAGDRGSRIDKRMNDARYVSWSVIIRTRIIDSFIEKLLSEGVDMVVNIGAGLDTRPYRMELPPELQWVEREQPANKEAIPISANTWISISMEGKSALQSTPRA